MKKKQQILFFVFVLGLIFSVSLFLNYHYEVKAFLSLPIALFMAPLSKCILWYPNYGVFLWIIKILFKIALIAFLVYLFLKYKNAPFFEAIKWKVIIFLGYFILAIFLEGNHPFSMIKMYSYLNDEVFVFYIDDCNGEMIPLQKLTSKDGARLSHLYYNFEEDTRIKKEEIGALMWQQLEIKIGDTCLCLNKSKINHANSFTKNPLVLYEACK